MVRGEKRYIDKLVRLLKIFSEASGTKINWENHVYSGLISIHTSHSGLQSTTENE